MRTDRGGALGRNALIALRQGSAKFSFALRTRWDGVLRTWLVCGTFLPKIIFSNFKGFFSKVA